MCNSGFTSGCVLDTYQFSGPSAMEPQSEQCLPILNGSTLTCVRRDCHQWSEQTNWFLPGEIDYKRKDARSM